MVLKVENDTEVAMLREEARLKAEKLADVLALNEYLTSRVEVLELEISELVEAKKEMEARVETSVQELGVKEDMLSKEREIVDLLRKQVAALEVEKKDSVERPLDDFTDAHDREDLVGLVATLQLKISVLEKQQTGVAPEEQAQEVVMDKKRGHARDGPEASSWEVDEVDEVGDGSSEDRDSLVEELRERLGDVKAERTEATERAERLAREVAKLQTKVPPWDVGDTMMLARSRSLWRELDDTQKELSQLRAERDFLARKIKSMESEEEWDKPNLLTRMFPFWDMCRSSWVQ